MSSSISSLINTGSTDAAAAATAANGTSATLDQANFLQLLTAQLQNQDPLQPMDDTQSVAELAQFSALQSQTQLSSSFASFQSNFAVTQAAGLIGQQVSASVEDSGGNTVPIQGTVKTVGVINGSPVLTLVDSSGKIMVDQYGKAYSVPTSDILSIGAGATATTPATGS
jgi:flagellar basal-body rod modification protein FlgD